MNKKIWQRFEELENEIKNIENTQEEREQTSNFSHSPSKRYTVIEIDSDLVLRWKIQVKDLIIKLVTKKSVYYKEFIEIDNSEYSSEYNIFMNLKVIFLTLKTDYRKGYLSSIKTLIQAEVFENQLEQSEELLKNGYILASAVITGVVLETSIREICSRENIIHGKLDKMNSDLAKAGIYNKLQQKRITALADIRNSAAHGKENEFTKEDVGMMIRDVENFLIKHLDDT